MDPQYQNHILGVCSAIGAYENIPIKKQTSLQQPQQQNSTKAKHFVLGDECLECLKDLKRFLRRDDLSKERHVHQLLGQWNIVHTKLLPILLEHSEKEKLVSAVIELLVPLTWPPNLDTEEIASELENLKSFKEAFLNEGALQPVLQFLLKILSIEPRKRTEKDHALIRLILILFRNIVAIRDSPTQATGSTESYAKAQMQEELLIRFKEERVLDLLLSFAGSLYESEFAEYNVIVLELFYHIFSHRDPRDIFDTSADQLKKAIEEEERQRKIASRIMTRHGRFGGTITLQFQDGKHFNVHGQNAAFKDIGEVLNANKKTLPIRKKPVEDDYHISKKLMLPESRKLYKELIQVFIEHCYNPFMASVKRDIDLERPHIREEDQLRYLWMIRFGLECQSFLFESDDEATKSRFEFDTVASVVSVRGLLWVVRMMGRFEDEKKWNELHVALDAFKQILNTLDAMAKSQNQEYVESSENIQNNLYYEKSTLDHIVALSKSHSFLKTSYLVSLIETVHILLKMLDRFSKNKTYMFVRRRKAVAAAAAAAKKKAKAVESSAQGVGQTDTNIAEDRVNPDGDEEEREDDEEQEEAAEMNRQKDEFVEDEFHFEKMEMAFASENVIATYMMLVSQYKTLADSTLHAITKMFHRIFVKCKMEALFYKLSILNVFNTIINETPTTKSTPKSLQELVGFITFAVRAFFKKLADYPALYIEILYPKSRSDVRRIQWGPDDEDMETNTKSKKGEKRGWGLEDEIEVKANLSWSEQVGVAVGLLMNQNRMDCLEWIQKVLTTVSKERENVLMGAMDKARLELNWDEVSDPFDEEMEAQKSSVKRTTSYEEYVIKPEEETIQVALRSSAALKLLMRLLDFEESKGPDAVVSQSSEQNADEELQKFASWIIADKLDSVKLSAHASLIAQFMTSPLNVDGKPVSKLVRKVRPKKRQANGDGQPKRRQKKKAEEDSQRFLSKQFVDSDEDLTDDEEFFRKERERMLKTATKNGQDSLDPLLKKDGTAKAKQGSAETDRNGEDIANASEMSINAFNGDEDDDDDNNNIGFSTSAANKDKRTLNRDISTPTSEVTHDMDSDETTSSDESNSNGSEIDEAIPEKRKTIGKRNNGKEESNEDDQDEEVRRMQALQALRNKRVQQQRIDPMTKDDPPSSNESSTKRSLTVENGDSASQAEKKKDTEGQESAFVDVSPRGTKREHEKVTVGGLVGTLPSPFEAKGDDESDINDDAFPRHDASPVSLKRVSAPKRRKMIISDSDDDE